MARRSISLEIENVEGPPSTFSLPDMAENTNRLKPRAWPTISRIHSMEVGQLLSACRQHDFKCDCQHSSWRAARPKVKIELKSKIREERSASEGGSRERTSKL